MIRGIAFDLDDTLVPEADYVRSGFAAVAAAVSASPEERAELTRWLVEAFDAGIRGDTFDRLRARYPEVASRATTTQMVAVYREHVPDIALPAESRTTVERLVGAGLRLGVVTDGPAASQSAKARALGLERWFEPIILTDTLGPGLGKPHVAAFEAVAADWGLPGASLAFVGDNPRKDFAGPRRLGWRTVRLRRAGQIYADLEPESPDHAADSTIGDLAELPGLLDGWSAAR